MFIPARRTTLLIPSPSFNDPDRKHLFILVTDPVGSDQEVLLVSLSTIRECLPFDRTCVVDPGVHDFVKYPSYVVYSLARIEKAESLLKGVKTGEMSSMGMMEEETFKRICAGVLDSHLSSPKFKRFYERANKK